MKYYLAPLEGVTGYIFRNTYEEFYGNVDKYFTPFLTPNQTKSFTTKERKDIAVEHNSGKHVIPQLLTCNALDFLWAAKELEQMGYKEINLNLGCPSKTVVTKKKGSGFLAYPKELDLFLEEVFSKIKIKLSLKVRLGKDDPEEIFPLIDIFNKYPLEELIIHPRVQTDYYKNKPKMDVFSKALSLSKNPVCYNGDIFTLEDYNHFTKAYPQIGKIMLGRGIIANPSLLDQIKGKTMKPDKDSMLAFHNALCEAYEKELSGDRNVLFKMKEIWFYMGTMFVENKKYEKEVKKSQRVADYKAAITAIFNDLELVDGAGFVAP